MKQNNSTELWANLSKKLQLKWSLRPPRTHNPQFCPDLPGFSLGKLGSRVLTQTFHGLCFDNPSINKLHMLSSLDCEKKKNAKE